jgi:hypothetical protein
MQQEIIRSQARDILNKLPESRLSSALNYLKILEKIPSNQLDALQDMLENLGWSILASEIIEEEWQ